MILDKGICTLFHVTDGAAPGAMPEKEYTPFFQSWYGLPSFETSPAWPTEGRKEQQITARIRVLQCRDIRQHDVAVLLDVRSLDAVPAGTPVYDVTRAYHGQDDDGPTLITDLSLQEVSP